MANSIATPEIVQRLTQLDHRLSQAVPRIPDADWDAWRRSLNPPPDRWWWRLDEAQVEAEKKRDLPWILLTGLLMTITLSLAVDIIRRIWGGGPDLLSVASTVLTLVLTGSPLTEQGRELAGWLMDKARLPARYRDETMAGAASLAFVTTVLLRLALPALAEMYNTRGVILLQVGDLTGAQRAFQRAVAINSEYAEAYYDLAYAYVNIGDYEQARSLYTQALAVDHTLSPAYSGLGYVLILQELPEGAIPILYAGLNLAQEDETRTALWTNLGRAYLEAGWFYSAQVALTEALALNPKEAAAHCTLALTAEALEHPQDEVILHWENCLRYANPATPRGQELAAMARAHLEQLEEGR